MKSAAKTAASPRRAPRDATINLRLSSKTRDVIDAAAALAGKSRTEFVIEAAEARATDVLLDQRVFVLNEADHAAFMQILDNPPEPNEALRRLMTRPAPWEK